MKTLLLILTSLLFSFSVMAQANKTANGNWDVSTNWASGNIGDVVTETVSISANLNNTTILNGETYTIGNFTLNQNCTVTINAGGTLNVGDATHTAMLITSDQNATLNIDGNLTVWGNVSIAQNININVTGSFVVKGNFTAAQHTDVVITGTGAVQVNGKVSVGNGSTLTTTAGAFQYGQACADGNSTSFCSNATSNPVLPIKLLYFREEASSDRTHLTWATATEVNFDKFEIQRYVGNGNFESIGSVVGHGNSKTTQKYEYYDDKFVGQVFYRLKSIDLDGSVDYSNVISVTSDITKKFIVYPNPAKSSEDVNFITNFNAGTDDKVIILDQTGNVSYVGNISSNKLNPQLTNGLYIIKYISRDYNTTIKLLIE